MQVVRLLKLLLAASHRFSPILYKRFVRWGVVFLTLVSVFNLSHFQNLLPSPPQAAADALMTWDHASQF